jgi:hypothetical protein
MLTDVSNDGQEQQNLDICKCTMKREDWNLNRNVINQSKIRWELGTFKLFKSEGTEENVTALLQQGAEHLVPYLCSTFTACLAYGFIHMAWMQVKMTFIPKPGKSDYTEAKAYCPLSLSSFLLKMMEKLEDRHIRDGVLKERPVH